MPTVANGSRFMAAFNEIESHLKVQLRFKREDEFSRVLASMRRGRFSTRQIDQLQDFSYLRNGIAHGKYYGSDPIADPTDKAVADIEQLRDQLIKPALVRDVIPQGSVQSVAPEQPLQAALRLVREQDFSQVPVYAQPTNYVGLLTTNAIARWVAANTDDEGTLAEAGTVAGALECREPAERAKLVGRFTTAVQAFNLLTDNNGGIPPVALIVTENGATSEIPLTIVTAADLGRLEAHL